MGCPPSLQRKKTLLSMLEELVVIVVPKVKKSIMCSGSSNKPSQESATIDTITHCSRLTVVETTLPKRIEILAFVEFRFGTKP